MARSFKIRAPQAALGYLFDHWELDGVDIGAANPITITMDADHTLLAAFAVEEYVLTISAGEGGTTDPAPGDYAYPAGGDATVWAIPE